LEDSQEGGEQIVKTCNSKIDVQPISVVLALEMDMGIFLRVPAVEAIGAHEVSDI
jgi:hypothetical protein